MADGIMVFKERPEYFMADPFMKVAIVDDASSGSDVSIVRAVLNGPHSRRVNSRSCKSYYILSGNCTFSVGDTQEIVSSGDYVVIKPGTEVAIQGLTCDMIIICTPPFREIDEVLLP
jgi:mannose-6-phosphate isomerase-like protein (cupin superfamily)